MRPACVVAASLCLFVYAAAEARVDLLMLSGPAADRANDHIPDLVIPPLPPGEAARDSRPDGTGLVVFRTRILIQFTETATVGEVNDLLRMLGATIVGTIRSIKLVVISIPDTGDFAGLDRALATMRSSPAISLAVEDAAMGPVRARPDRLPQ